MSTEPISIEDDNTAVAQTGLIEIKTQRDNPTTGTSDIID